MADKIKAKVGDIFQMPIDDTRVGYGQVVVQPERKVLFVCAFAATTRPGEQPDLNVILRSEILLAGNTFDAKIWHGHWPVVGNLPPNMGTIVLPNYKEGLPGQALVESLDRTRRRRATIDEERLLPFRLYVAPVGFEKALKALFGIGEWLADDEDLRYDRVRQSGLIVI